MSDKIPPSSSTVRGAMTGCVFEVLEATAMLFEISGSQASVCTVCEQGYDWVSEQNILINDPVQRLFFSSSPPLDKPNALSLVGASDELCAVFLSVDIHFLEYFKACY